MAMVNIKTDLFGLAIVISQNSESQENAHDVPKLPKDATYFDAINVLQSMNQLHPPVITVQLPPQGFQQLPLSQYQDSQSPVEQQPLMLKLKQSLLSPLRS